MKQFKTYSKQERTNKKCKNKKEGRIKSQLKTQRTERDSMFELLFKSAFISN